jgi:hypothetical protein
MKLERKSIVIDDPPGTGHLLSVKVACSVPVNLINYSYLCHKLLKICIIKLKTKIPKLIFNNRQYWTDSAPSEKRKWIS